MSEKTTEFDAWFKQHKLIGNYFDNFDDIEAAFKAGQESKISGLQADLEAAVNVAFHRGGTEWAELNYPDIYKQIVKPQKGVLIMTDKSNNHPAYPKNHGSPGMTMRQAYKKALANGMISSESMVAAILVAANDQSVSFNDAFAAMASDLADAMLAEDAAHDAKVKP